VAIASWAAFEAEARLALEARFRVALPCLALNIRGKAKKLDFVNAEHKLAGDAKFYSFTAGGSSPSARFSTLNENCRLLQKLPADRRKFLVIGENAALVDTYVRRYGPWLRDVEILYFSRLQGLRSVKPADAHG
jgi:hypothetical protein